MGALDPNQGFCFQKSCIKTFRKLLSEKQLVSKFTKGQPCPTYSGFRRCTVCVVLMQEKIDNARKMIYNELNIHGLLSGGKRPAFSKQSPQHHALSHVRRSEGSARERISKAHQSEWLGEEGVGGRGRGRNQGRWGGGGGGGGGGTKDTEGWGRKGGMRKSREGERQGEGMWQEAKRREEGRGTRGGRKGGGGLLCRWSLLTPDVTVLTLHSGLLSLEEVSRSTMLPPITRDSKSPPPPPGGSSMGRSTERLPADERPLPALAKRYRYWDESMCISGPQI